MHFDPDALLAALPRREIRPLIGKRLRSTIQREIRPTLGEKGEYNGFSGRERQRTAEVSKKLIVAGATIRHGRCDICGGSADDEHAENYYDLSSWVDLCRTCHRNTLHKRFTNPKRWQALLDQHQVSSAHWARLLSAQPFDLAELLRHRGFREPTLFDFAR